MKLKTAKVIKEIMEKVKYKKCYLWIEKSTEETQSHIVMDNLEFERALLMAYGAGITAGKKNPNEEV